MNKQEEMTNTQIDKRIELLQTKKHKNAIMENLKKHCYDTLFFTYEANYKNKVHFSYFAYSSSHDCYAVLCKEDEWLDDGSDDGHKLDIIELLDEEAVFMNWEEAVRDMCPKCKKYLPLNQVVIANAKALRLQGDEVLNEATDTKTKLYKQASRLEELSNGN